MLLNGVPAVKLPSAIDFSMPQVEHVAGDGLLLKRTVVTGRPYYLNDMLNLKEYIVTYKKCGEE